MQTKYKREMDFIVAQVADFDRKLDRQIADLDDIRIIMETQKKIRDQAWTFLLLISDRDLCYVLFPFFHRRSTWI